MSNLQAMLNWLCRACPASLRGGGVGKRALTIPYFLRRPCTITGLPTHTLPGMAKCCLQGQRFEGC